MKPPKPLFPLCVQLYVKIISLTLIPLIYPPDLIDMKRKKRLKNNPRKNNQWDLLLKLAAMYHQFTPHPHPTSFYANQPITKPRSSWANQLPITGYQ